MPDYQRPPTPVEGILPRLHAERCVHSRITQASCRACVDTCPTGAWVINEERLGIDPSRCDGCDLCVPVCPEGALTSRFHPVVRQTRHGAFAFAACHYTGLADRDLPLAPCLNALSILDLLRLVRDQIGQLVTAAGDCARCPRGQGEGLRQRLAAVNQLLVRRGLPRLAHQALSVGDWEQAWHAAADPGNHPTLNRRAFFRSAVTVPLRRVRETLDPAEGDEHLPGRLLPPARPGDPFPLAPVMDTLLCSGCDACLRTCPQGVIQLERQEGRAQAYVIAAENCSGCGLCEDVCATQAMNIQRWAPLPQPRIPLIEERCGSCGVTFHLPRGGIPTHDRRASAPSRCPICFQVDHQRHLYQVLA